MKMVRTPKDSFIELSFQLYTLEKIVKKFFKEGEVGYLGKVANLANMRAEKLFLLKNRNIKLNNKEFKKLQDCLSIDFIKDNES